MTTGSCDTVTAACEVPSSEAPPLGRMTSGIGGLAGGDGAGGGAAATTIGSVRGAAGAGTGAATTGWPIGGGAGGTVGAGGSTGATAVIATGASLCHSKGLYWSGSPGRPAATQSAPAHKVAISAIQSPHRGFMTCFQAVVSVTAMYHATALRRYLGRPAAQKSCLTPGRIRSGSRIRRRMLDEGAKKLAAPKPIATKSKAGSMATAYIAQPNGRQRGRVWPNDHPVPVCAAALPGAAAVSASAEQAPC